MGELLFRQSRGARRGQLSSTTLTGLRDGVKRRLFDPNTVPVTRDPQTVISRLRPIPPAPLRVQSLLKHATAETDADQTVAPESGDPTTDYKSAEFIDAMFRLECLFEYAFRNGPDMHKLPQHEDGISLSRLTEPAEAEENAPLTGRFSKPLSRLHLLLDHASLARWHNGAKLRSRYNPRRWYPKELVRRSRNQPLRSAQARQAAMAKLAKTNSASAAKKRTQVEVEPESVDRAIERAQQELEAEEDDDAEDTGGEHSPSTLPNRDCTRFVLGTDAVAKAKRVKKENALNSDNEEDPEDSRWNQTAAVEASDDEDDNDYCQNYFDNGEGDDAFDHVRMDDGEGDVENYYD